MFIGAVLWPDSTAREAFDEVRRQFDPHVHLIGPHITVIFPFETEAAVSSIAEAVSASVVDFHAFRMRMGKVSTMSEQAAAHPEGTRLLAGYPNAKNVIYVVPDEGYDETLELKRRINAAIDRVDALVDYPPFLTLGQTLADADYARALQQLASWRPAFQFAAESLDLVTQKTDGTWETVQRVPLRL